MLNANFASNGRGFAAGQQCAKSQRLGRIQGNTCHGHGRFGTYILGPNFPRATDESVASDGHVVDRSTCDGFTAEGADRGVSTAIGDNVDFDVVFVGQCALTSLSQSPAPSPQSLPDRPR